MDISKKKKNVVAFGAVIIGRYGGVQLEWHLDRKVEKSKYNVWLQLEYLKFMVSKKSFVDNRWRARPNNSMTKSFATNSIFLQMI